MNAMNPARRGAALLAGLLLTLSARSSQPLGAERAVGLCAGQCAGAREGVRMGSRLQDFALAMRLRGSGDVASHVGAGASAEGGGAGGACAVADAGDRESEREKKKRASVLSNTIFLRGLPAFANEEWIAILIGRTSVATDEQSGARKVYIYRDEHGTPTGSCVVGLVSVEEALRVEAGAQRQEHGGRRWLVHAPRARRAAAPREACAASGGMAAVHRRGDAARVLLQHRHRQDAVGRAACQRHRPCPWLAGSGAQSHLDRAVHG